MAQKLTLFREGTFDDRATRTMGAAYDLACGEAGVNDPESRDLVAKRILARANLGIADADQLREYALAGTFPIQKLVSGCGFTRQCAL